jgi:putative membrane protein insertion efficiency factor
VNLVQYILILFVRLYQWVVSPVKSMLFGPVGPCRFNPSCSQYAIDAIRIHGALKGCAMAAWRICRCNPWGRCGEDPVLPRKSTPDNSTFKALPDHGTHVCDAGGRN